MNNKGFTLVEVVIAFTFLGLIIGLVAYINIQSFNNKKNLIHYYITTQSMNVEEIIKSDYQFFDHLGMYYYDNLLIVQESGIYHHIMIYFDQNNKQCSKEYGRFMIKVSYNSNVQTKYTHQQYEIFRYDINQTTKYENSFGNSIKISYYKKK